MLSEPKVGDLIPIVLRNGNIGIFEVVKYVKLTYIFAIDLKLKELK